MIRAVLPQMKEQERGFIDISILFTGRLNIPLFKALMDYQNGLP